MHHQWCPAKSHDSSFLIIFVPLHSYLCLVMVCLYSYARPDMPGYLHYMLPWIFEVPSQSGSKHISYTHTHIYISSMLAVSYHIQSLSDFLYMKNILQPLLCKFLPTCNDWKGASAKLIFDVLIKRTLLPRVKASLYLFFNCPFACSSVYSIAIFIYPSRHARVPR